MPSLRNPLNRRMLLVSALIGVAISAGVPWLDQQRFGEPAPTKPYLSFAAFYRAYAAHPAAAALRAGSVSVLACHMLANPPIALAIAAALAAGRAAVPVLRHVEHGLLELAVVLMVYLALASWLCQNWKNTAVPLALGVGALCVGRFYVQHNDWSMYSIYPTYALMAEAILWFQAISGYDLKLNF